MHFDDFFYNFFNLNYFFHNDLSGDLDSYDLFYFDLNYLFNLNDSFLFNNNFVRLGDCDNSLDFYGFFDGYFDHFFNLNYFFPFSFKIFLNNYLNRYLDNILDRSFNNYLDGLFNLNDLLFCNYFFDEYFDRGLDNCLNWWLLKINCFLNLDHFLDGDLYNSLGFMINWLFDDYLDWSLYYNFIRL